ncbi:two-component system, NtrC family, response regulator [Maridesulfovibrio ferrireducens]|uniref:Two-component system, NtrC family, response regulator n=1 Tax=Maridesulfovibrio ferrireducens TaxID=246191 RepID=A0A1G9EYZ5_9BACT|nr:sigma-54 dependent transcriptional regulator [Maridesulfovibrio ferrireducens]SDK81407.1 two-component system, NtrC family, response regulator [Maridesulfovibrio ferrireducens]
MHTILIIDDDLGFQYVLKRLVESKGHEVLLAETIQQGLQLAADHEPAAVYLDISLPDGNGVDDALPELCRLPNRPEIIMITGLGSQEEAGKALQQGAYDYISKNTPVEEILAVLTQALELFQSRTAKSDAIHKGETFSHFDRSRLVGTSEPFLKCIELARQFSGTDSNVLLLGETGTGKELFARTIHENSHRKHNSFVTVDCASLPEKIAASILFGHIKGAFTSAESTQEGLVAKADGGTLFLDEIGELSLDLQKLFLRVLQEHCFRQVGSTQEKPCDFRLIAATNKDLYQLSQDGSFRNDLYYRLQTCVINLPPLSNRDHDIVELAEMFLKSFCKKQKQPLKSCSETFLQALTGYVWEGNVRELENAIEFALSAADAEPVLCVHHLPPAIRIQVAKTKFARATAGENQDTITFSAEAESDGFPSFTNYKEVMGTQSEKTYISKIYEMSGGNIHKMMELSNLSRSRCYALIKQHLK